MYVFGNVEADTHHVDRLLDGHSADEWSERLNLERPMFEIWKNPELGYIKTATVHEYEGSNGKRTNTISPSHNNPSIGYFAMESYRFTGNDDQGDIIPHPGAVADALTPWLPIEDSQRLATTVLGDSDNDVPGVDHLSLMPGRTVLSHTGEYAARAGQALPPGYKAKVYDINIRDD